MIKYALFLKKPRAIKKKVKLSNDCEKDTTVYSNVCKEAFTAVY